MCIESENTATERFWSSRTHCWVLVVQHGCMERPFDDLHRRRQDSDIAAEAGMDKVLVNHKHESVAAMTGPNEVAEYMVRIVCDWLDEWRYGVCSLKCQMSQQRSHCRTLLTGRDESRQLHETLQGIHMTVWVTVNQPSKRWRIRYVY